MRYELKSVGIWAFTKVAFFFNLIIGFIFGLIYALFLGFFLTLMSNLPFFPQEEIDVPADFSFGIFVVILPIFAAVGGAIFYTLFGIVCIGVYNLVARVTGGMEFELNPLTPTSSPQPLSAPARPAPIAPDPPAHTTAQATPPPPPPVVEPPLQPPPQSPPPQPPPAESKPEKPDDDRFKPPDLGGT